MLSATFQVGWQNGTYFRGICGEVFYSLRTKEAKLWPFFHWISLFITDKLNVCGIWKIQRLSMSSQTTEAIKLMLPFRQQKYLLCGAWAISWSSSPKGERDCVTYTLLSSPIHRLAAKTLVPRLANDCDNQFWRKRFSYEVIWNERMSVTDYSAKQAPTAEAEHSILALTCRNVSVISSLGAVFLNFIDLICSTALPVCFTGEWQHI